MHAGVKTNRRALFPQEDPRYVATDSGLNADGSTRFATKTRAIGPRINDWIRMAARNRVTNCRAALLRRTLESAEPQWDALLLQERQGGLLEEHLHATNGSIGAPTGANVHLFVVDGDAASTLWEQHRVVWRKLRSSAMSEESRLRTSVASAVPSLAQQVVVLGASAARPEDVWNQGLGLRLHCGPEHSPTKVLAVPTNPISRGERRTNISSLTLVGSRERAKSLGDCWAAPNAPSTE